MKSIAIIGAGVSGLSAIKCCLSEGLEPVCFELSADIGGIWRYTEAVHDRQACVIKSTVANLSKEMMCYSDFPPDKEVPIYMHNSDALKYFKKYASYHKLLSRIQFNTEVIHIEKSKDFIETGRWLVTTKDKTNENKNLEQREFDGVLVCTGCFTDPHIPVFPRQQVFQGKVVHSQHYKTNQEYEGQRVLVIGIGNTAGDIAVDLSSVASKVMISNKKGAWLLSRLGPKGYPWDMTTLTRLKNFVATRFPTFTNKYLYDFLNNKIDHNTFSLRPNFPPLLSAGFLNDDLPNRIISGRVTLHSDVKMFTETGVEFVDGSYVDNIDTVILATGYRTGFPYLDADILNDSRNLYKAVFPPSIEKNTIGFIGYFRLRGPVIPVVEMQSRLVARVFQGEISLPSSQEMLVDIERRQEGQKSGFPESQNYAIQLNYIPYMDELSKVIGCQPKYGKLWLTDPRLAMKVCFGPCTPYQYRLSGPGAWSGARNAIMSIWDRSFYPVNTRHVHDQWVMKNFPNVYICLLVCLLAFVVLYNL